MGMNPQLQCLGLAILLLCCIFRDISFGSKCSLVDFERPATVSITGQSCDGGDIWGYVEVRKGAYLFWNYSKSPHHHQRPWPTVFYAAPAAASSGHGNFTGIGAGNSTWPHNADLLVVDSPVGTGNSYEEATNGNRLRSLARTTFLQEAADILVLLRALSREIATLQRSPLILLPSSTHAGTGTYDGRISTVVGLAIRTGALNNSLWSSSPSGDSGGLVESFDSRIRSKPEQDQIIDTRCSA